MNPLPQLQALARHRDPVTAPPSFVCPICERAAPSLAGLLAATNATLATAARTTAPAEAVMLLAAFATAVRDGLYCHLDLCRPPNVPASTDTP